MAVGERLDQEENLLPAEGGFLDNFAGWWMVISRKGMYVKFLDNGGSMIYNIMIVSVAVIA